MPYMRVRPVWPMGEGEDGRSGMPYMPMGPWVPMSEGRRGMPCMPMCKVDMSWAGLINRVKMLIAFSGKMRYIVFG